MDLRDVLNSWEITDFKRVHEQILDVMDFLGDFSMEFMGCLDGFHGISSKWI